MKFINWYINSHLCVLNPQKHVLKREKHFLLFPFAVFKFPPLFLHLKSALLHLNFLFSKTASLQNRFVISAKRFCNSCKTVLQALQNRLAEN